MNKVIEIENYLTRFINTRRSGFQSFYRDVKKHRQHPTGIYRLKRGTEMLDMLHEIDEAFSYRLTGKLVPEKFTTPNELIQYLINLRDQILSFRETIKKNYSYIEEIKIHRYENEETEKVFNMIAKMIDYVLDIYDVRDDLLPIHRLKKALVDKDISSFVEITNGLLSNISYLIAKDKEGYLHSNITLLLKLLGFDINSEDSTNMGRIDASINFSKIIYVIEFKRNGEPEDAIKQIRDMKYYEKFESEQKQIILVGIAFDKKNRRIEKYKSESL